MTLSLPTLHAVLAMGIATYLTRIAGLWVLRHVTLTPRVRAGLDAVPVAVLTAVITPMVFMTGPAEALAGLATALAAFRLPILAVVAVGVVSVVGLRALIG
ncbi:AzlD domain-containing protein [Kaustia mangrovi]|uniref:AzlD domain-containing protein n=1 Tax=Kaustia mangrovi TaxID=2593653 RepID=A0A7S8C235_9HYPH|nr:AzlD domain-containing protein [Kaustia mangrovi]QPC41887.1 AzlD domain-containing protein [Kaustia mangrovi]